MDPPSSGLPTDLRRGMEDLSGVPLDDVRVHYNSPAPRQILAHAFTRGTEVHLGPGQERHLPHEAWHVVQQKRGRVSPTHWLGDTAVNHSASLEREADTMGGRAARGEVGPPVSPARTVSASPDPPLQAVWILRNGGPVWEDDPYVLQPGEAPYIPNYFQQRPQVIFNKGKQRRVFDKTGKRTTEKVTSKPPTHPKLQAKRELQGKALRKRAKKRSLADLQADTTALGSLATTLESQAGSSVPTNHAKKIRTAHQNGPISGSAFRGIIKGQDEFTQSESTSSFIRGFREQGGDTPPHYSQAVNDYEEQLLRTMSSLRAPTRAIVAPVEDDTGQVTGQQHPTEDDQPVLDGGSSGHAYADRGRVQQQNTAFDDLSSDASAPPNAIFFGSLLASGTATLSTMSHPLSRSNGPVFNPTGREQQRQERERIKEQVNTIAASLGLEVATSEQNHDAPLKGHPTPSSPKRQAQTTFSAKAIQAFQEQWQALRDILQELAGTTGYHDNPVPNHQVLTHIWQALHRLANNDPAGQQTLEDLYGYAYQWFVAMRNAVKRKRRHVGAGGPANDALGAHGHRCPALRQFFAECGQMAAHNVLTLVPGLNWQDTEENLNRLGAFDNDIGEDDIRAMLVAVGQNQIPVVGSLAQMQTLVHYVQTDDVVALFNNDIRENERASLDTLNAFILGHTNQVDLVLNTTGHLGDSDRGHHWITARVIRQPDGQIAVRYLDSLDADGNYAALFAALRLAFGHAPPPPAVAPVIGGGP